MNKFKYIFKRLKSMDYLSFFYTIKRIHQKTSKNSFIIFLDIIYCGFKYMAGYVDYEVFEFYNIKKEQRGTIITRGINNKYVKELNDKNYFKYIDNKILFNEKYNKFLKRDWLDLRKTSIEDFSKFIKNKKAIMAKTIDLCCGKGIEKIIYNSNINLEKLYYNLKQNKQFLIEEYVYQHEDINKLYPESVNTLRIVTLLKDNNPHVVFVGLRIGNLGNVVDNFNHGGLLAYVNSNGIIEEPAIDKQGKTYDIHPYTNTKIVGYKIPYFDEAISFAKELALITPEIKYTAWDISITNNGPVVIEGNPFPGHDVYFSKMHIEKKKAGLLLTFQNILYAN